MEHELVLVSEKIDEQPISGRSSLAVLKARLFCDVGPLHDACLMLKQLYNLGVKTRSKLW
ncbi:MAG: hypothetical protein ACOX5T_02135 [Candidatus Cryptobacteroides sp.]|jgi:hypothetical protein